MTQMATRTPLFTAVALSFALAVPAFAQDSTAAEPAPEAPAAEAPAATPAMDVDASTVLATVNGETITLGHVLAARQNLPQQYQKLPDDVLLPGLVEQLIQQTVLSQSMGDEMTRRAQIQLENDKRAIVAGEKLDEMTAAAVDDAKIQAMYDSDYANAVPTKEWNASHILVATEDEAKAIVEQLKGGADFAELAKEKSTGPSGPNGGELGWFGPGMMVKEFEDTVQGMEVGAIAGPVQTQFGWHVIKLNDTRMKAAPPLADVRDEIVSKLQDAAVQKGLQDLMDGATIERTDTTNIDPSVISDMSLLD